MPMTRQRAEALEAERAELLNEAEAAIQTVERNGGRQTAEEDAAIGRALDRVEAIDREREGVRDPRPVSGLERLGRIAHVLHLAATRRDLGGGGVVQVARNTFHDPRFTLEVRAATAPALTTTPAWAGALLWFRVAAGSMYITGHSSQKSSCRSTMMRAATCSKRTCRASWTACPNQSR